MEYFALDSRATGLEHFYQPTWTWIEEVVRIWSVRVVGDCELPNVRTAQSSNQKELSSDPLILCYCYISLTFNASHHSAFDMCNVLFLLNMLHLILLSATSISASHCDLTEWLSKCRVKCRWRRQSNSGFISFGVGVECSLTLQSSLKFKIMQKCCSDESHAKTCTVFDHGRT